MKMSCKVVLIMCLFYCIYLSAALTRYSKEANLPVVEEEEDWRKVDRPFRLAKINLVWTKAQKVSKLINVFRFLCIIFCLYFCRG